MPDSAPAFPKRELALESDPETVEPQRSVELDTIFLGGLLLLAVLVVFYAAAEIVLPIVLAFVLNLVCQPILRALERMYVPRMAASLVIVLALVGLFVVLGLLLSAPVAGWIAQLPETLPRLQAKLSFLNSAMSSLQQAAEHIRKLAPDTGPPAIAVQATALPERLFAAMSTVAHGALATLLVLFFVLISGDRFLRRLVEILPGFKEKRQAVDISQQIQADISGYLATITIMNTAVGVATGIVMWLCGLGSPLLWGTIAFLLNFVPILGPTAGVVVFLWPGW